jgi:hypothetical protein
MIMNLYRYILTLACRGLVHNSNDILMVDIENGRKKIEDLQW